MEIKINKKYWIKENANRTKINARNKSIPTKNQQKKRRYCEGTNQNSHPRKINTLRKENKG